MSSLLLLVTPLIRSLYNDDHDDVGNHDDDDYDDKGDKDDDFGETKQSSRMQCNDTGFSIQNMNNKTTLEAVINILESQNKKLNQASRCQN